MRYDMQQAPERRSLSVPLELRATSKDELTLTGYASVFNEGYDIYGGPSKGGFTEIVDRGAFDKTLAASPDLHLLINHAGMPLARTKSGTLQLSTDKKGLLVSASLDRGSSLVRDLESAMNRGDMDEMSFAFRVLGEKWNEDETVRSLTEVSLNKGDVSVVNFGANPATSAELKRALQELRGNDVEGAQRTLTKLIGRQPRPRVTRALGDGLDPDAVIGMLVQSLGWLTAIDNIADGITEGDPEFAGADLATLLLAVDAIADEGSEAITMFLGLPSSDPDDMDPAEGRSVKRAAAPAGRKTLSLSAALALG